MYNMYAFIRHSLGLSGFTKMNTWLFSLLVNGLQKTDETDRVKASF